MERERGGKREERLGRWRGTRGRRGVGIVLNVVASAFLLLQLEIIERHTKVTEDHITKILEFTQHFRFELFGPLLDDGLEPHDGRVSGVVLFV